MFMKKIKVVFIRISKWCHENFMVFKPDICHFTVLCEPNHTCNLTCNGTTIKGSKEKVLGIKVDDRLNFRLHLENII